MFVLANFLKALGIVLRIFIYFEIFVIVVDAILSWFPHYTPLKYFFYSAAQPVLRPLRRFIPPLGTLDITPFIGILLLIFLDNFLVQTLFDLAVRLK